MADQFVYLVIRPLCAKLVRYANDLDPKATYCEILIGLNSKSTQNCEQMLKFPA